MPEVNSITSSSCLGMSVSEVAELMDVVREFLAIAFPVLVSWLVVDVPHLVQCLVSTLHV